MLLNDARRSRLAEFAAGLGLEVARITAPGSSTGDVLRVSRARDDVYGARGHPTVAASNWLSSWPRVESASDGARGRALHLKSTVTALPDGTVIGWDPVVDDPDAFDRYESMPEKAGAHVVRIGADHLLMAASAPRTADLLRSRGYTVTVVDISEYEKLEGCVTCLSVRLR